MRTPKEYSDNIKNGIITRNMLAECLFSVNKRAKNCRDKEREYRSYRYDRYGNEEKYREKKEGYYKQKDFMLTLLKPTCIHTETTKRRERIYEYEPEYWDYAETSEVIYENGYYDKDMREYVSFVDVMVDNKRYYLFYDLGQYSFHTPIYAEEIEKYPELTIKDIGELITCGKKVTDLLSEQFVKKMLNLLLAGEYKLID